MCAAVLQVTYSALRWKFSGHTSFHSWNCAIVIGSWRGTRTRCVCSASKLSFHASEAAEGKVTSIDVGATVVAVVVVAVAMRVAEPPAAAAAAAVVVMVVALLVVAVVVVLVVVALVVVVVVKAEALNG